MAAGTKLLSRVQPDRPSALTHSLTLRVVMDPIGIVMVILEVYRSIILILIAEDLYERTHSRTPASRPKDLKCPGLRQAARRDLLLTGASRLGMRGYGYPLGLG